MFFEVPKLHAFEVAAFRCEVDDVGSSFGGNAIVDNQFLRRSVSVINYHALDEKGVGHSQLNRAERAVPKADVYHAMILSAVNVRIAQEVPDEAPGVKKSMEDESQEDYEGQDSLFLRHLWGSVPFWF